MPPSGLPHLSVLPHLVKARYYHLKYRSFFYVNLKGGRELRVLSDAQVVYRLLVPDSVLSRPLPFSSK